MPIPAELHNIGPVNITSKPVQDAVALIEAEAKRINDDNTAAYAAIPVPMTGNIAHGGGEPIGWVLALPHRYSDGTRAILEFGDKPFIAAEYLMKDIAAALNYAHRERRLRHNDDELKAKVIKLLKETP